MPVESPYLLISQISTFGYFFYLMVIIPFFSELQVFFNQIRLYLPFFVKTRPAGFDVEEVEDDSKP